MEESIFGELFEDKTLPKMIGETVEKGSLQGVFGMCEMEGAARIIADICLERNCWRKPFSMWRCQEEMLGFCHLIYGGFLRPSYPNSLWYVTQEFIERLTIKKDQIRP